MVNKTFFNAFQYISFFAALIEQKNSNKMKPLVVPRIEPPVDMFIFQAFKFMGNNIYL